MHQSEKGMKASLSILSWLFLHLTGLCEYMRLCFDDVTVVVHQWQLVFDFKLNCGTYTILLWYS